MAYWIYNKQWHAHSWRPWLMWRWISSSIWALTASLLTTSKVPSILGIFMILRDEKENMSVEWWWMFCPHLGVVPVQGADDRPLNMRADAFSVEVVRSVVFGIQAVPSIGDATLIDVSVTQLLPRHKHSNV